MLTLQSSAAELDLEGLVGAWLFDEGSGNVAKDFSLNGIDGKLMNGPKWVEGKFGKALEFDGKDDYVDITDKRLLFDESITIIAWIQINSTSGAKTIAASGYNQGLPYWLFEINGDKIRVYTHDKYDSGSTSLKTGKWYHVAFAGDVKSGGEMYLDGSVDGQIPPWGKGQGEPVAIGTGYSGRYFNGLIDEVAIFNVVLKLDLILGIMKKGLIGISAVSPSGKLATTWSKIKR
jgi:hypothetical protein